MRSINANNIPALTSPGSTRSVSSISTSMVDDNIANRCNVCKEPITSQRSHRYHQRRCEKPVSLPQSGDRNKTDCHIESQDPHHSASNGETTNSFRYLQTSADSEDFCIRTPVKTPPVGDIEAWRVVNQDITHIFMNGRPYKQDDHPDKQLKSLNDFLYDFFSSRFGCKNNECQMKKSAQNKGPKEGRNIRQLKRANRRAWKEANNKENKAPEGVLQPLRKEYYHLLKLHNKMRKGNENTAKVLSAEKQMNSFREDPHRFSQNMFKPVVAAPPTFTKDNLEESFKATYCDDSRGMEYSAHPSMQECDKPSHLMDMKPPTLQELKLSLKKKRNRAAPGPNGLPYTIYKKLPIVLEHFHIIILHAWPNFPTTDWKVGRTALIHKSGSTDDPQNFRPITMTNTDGKILLSVIAKRALEYMKGNKYYNISVQKGFINDMAGCAEHTTMLIEMLRNAKANRRQITVCWTDLANAFGSLRHDLIQFALSWYHFPESFRKFVYHYYDGLLVKVKTEMWTTDVISVQKGIFQGCPLSVHLFNIVWNLALDMLEKSKDLGYTLKDSNIQVSHICYADDLTIITRTPGDNQKLIDILDEFLNWTACMKAKPTKCKSLAFRVFPSTKYAPLTESSYSTYDPLLTVNNENIPSIEKAPFKFLGRKVDYTLNDERMKEEVRSKLIELINILDQASITGAMKSWAYNNYIVPYITWELTIYDFSVSFGEELEAKITLHLKKWLGLSKNASPSILYRSTDHFGLSLTKITTHLKNMQVCRMHLLKYSQDPKSRDLYAYLKQRLQPRCNRLGLPLPHRVWSAVNTLENAERDIKLDSMVRPAYGKTGLGFIERPPCSSNKERRQEVSRRITQDDEHAMLVKCHSYAMQGEWTKYDGLMNADWSWQTLVWSLSGELLKFALNASLNVLPTPDNLRRWSKTKDAVCSLCGTTNTTLLHILNGCPTSLHQGRYTWRHDNIVCYISKFLESTMNNYHTVPTDCKEKPGISFVREGEILKSKNKSQLKASILQNTHDWQILYDYDGSSYVFPPHIATTALRPDIVIYSDSIKTVVVLELTVPAEENVQRRHQQKRHKYESLLMDACQLNGWKTHLFPVEVGSKGYVAFSMDKALKNLGLTNKQMKTVRRVVSNIALRCSYTIYLSRKNKVWRAWERSTPNQDVDESPQLVCGGSAPGNGWR